MDVLLGFPVATAGQAIGLLGGSFDPAHQGHVAITQAALRRLGLDRVWWLVSPGNPLKQRGPAAMDSRIAAARAVIRDPRVVVSDLERRLGTRYTSETLARLFPLYPGVRFVWLMGSDNLAGFHRWQNWQTIMETVPVCVFARPDGLTRARGAKAARVYAQARVAAGDAALLKDCGAPAWCFLELPLRPESSTEIRRAGDWRSAGAEARPKDR